MPLGRSPVDTPAIFRQHGLRGDRQFRAAERVLGELTAGINALAATGADVDKASFTYDITHDTYITHNISAKKTDLYANAELRRTMHTLTHKAAAFVADAVRAGVPLSEDAPQMRLEGQVQQQLTAARHSLVGRFPLHGPASPPASLPPLGGYERFVTDADVTSAPLPLKANRVALPETAGRRLVSDALPPSLGHLYASQAGGLLRDPGDVVPLPQERVYARVHEDKVEYPKLIAKMCRAHMIKLELINDFVARGGVFNDVFVVEKDDEEDRLIVNAKPANERFVASPHVDLPTPDVWTKIQAPPGTTLRVAKTDLRHYFHQLRLDDWMTRFFGLRPVQVRHLLAAGMRRSELPAGITPDDVLVPVYQTLPMGFSHAMFVAQEAHLHFCVTDGGLAKEDQLTVANGLLVDRPRWMTFCDDKIILAPSDQANRAEGWRQLNHYRDAVRACGWIDRKPSKDVNFMARANVLGYLVDGERLQAGLDPAKLVALVGATAAIRRKGSITLPRLRELLGHWIWAVLAFRPLFSVFNHVFHLRARLERQALLDPSVMSARHQLGLGAAKELLLLERLAPCLRASLFAGWAPTILATDASTAGFGVVEAPFAPQQAAAFIAHAAALPGVDDTHVEQAWAGAQWKTLMAVRWRDAEHINTLEFRALLIALRRLLRVPERRAVWQPLFTDSSVVWGVVAKGRSSSRSLLPLSRRLAALLLAGDLRAALAWISTRWMPADEPSRKFDR